MKRGPFGGNLKKAYFVPNGYKVYEQQHAINKDYSLGSYFINEKKYYELKNFEVGPGDYIVSCSGTIGRLYRLPKEASYGVINQALLKITLEDRLLEHSYFTYLFQSEYFQRNILSDARGTGMQNLAGMKEIKDVPVLVPPLPEQRKIIKILDELLSNLDNGIANLKKAEEKLEVYRQAVLKKAFEGELTKDWRKKQINLLSGDEILEQINKERLKHYKNQVQEWEKAVQEWEVNGKKGKRPTRISKPKTLEGINEDEIKQYGSLPEKWKWNRFCNVTYKIGDIDHKMPKVFPGGLPYLSTGNLKTDGTIDFDHAKTISPEDFYRLSLKIKPERGDIIFPRYGTIGRNILINFDKIFLVSYSCAIIKNILNVMDEKFVYYYSISPIIKKEIKRYTVQTTQANIGISSIERFVFPICSKQEQTQIVQEIETRLSVCDNIRANINEGLEKAESLRQSILKKAFEGNLLRESELEACRKETDWEPAEKLLERIKKEKK